MSSSSVVARSRDTLPMAVDNMTFMVNRLGQDCAPLQYVRELTQNAVEAILQLPGKSGAIYWDVFWSYFDLDEKGTYKLACIDTGAGMTGEEMVKYLNNLSSSIHEQSAHGNFGVGAKVAAAPLNPHGLVYLSWKGGRGYMIHLWFDPVEEVYGLKRFAQNNNEFWCYVEDSLKPKQIKDTGTVVVLLGRDDDDNTMEPPAGTPMRSRWVLRYLNTRYVRFPEGVTVHAREGWELPRADTKHNFLRQVEGQGAWLTRNSSARGHVELQGARAHWWILPPTVDTDSGHTAPGGHVAALYKDELYEMSTGRAGLGRLQGFGVIFGTNQVVIYIEPTPTLASDLIANTARTQLLMNGEPLPWGEWAAEFRAKMPDEITHLQEEIGARSGETDHRKAIRERLKQIRDLLRFSRFRPVPDGRLSIDGALAGGGLAGAEGGHQRDKEQRQGGRAGRSGDIFALFAQGGETTADSIDSMSEPERRWIRASDGTRTPPSLDDRAASFRPEQNLLLINADFRAFTDMVDRWTSAYAHVPGAKKIVEDTVHEWFEQQLVESVMSAMALRRAGSWSIQELEKLWSEEALTTAILPRWHIDRQLRRDLGTKLGTLKAA